MSASAVYPRVCGGTLSGALCGVVRLGLSPRVRGNPYEHVYRLVRHRSIPACAGEPPSPPPSSRPPWVYPRVCGGTIGGNDDDFRAQGLSPRVRGNPA